MDAWGPGFYKFIIQTPTVTKFIRKANNTKHSFKGVPQEAINLQTEHQPWVGSGLDALPLLVPVILSI